MDIGISARRGLLAALITAALTLCLAGSAAAAWNPLAPFDYTFSDARDLSVEYNSDGSAHSVWVRDGATFREFSADGQTPLYSFTVDYTFASGELSDVEGIAADHANGLLYVSDSNNHRVVAFDIGDGTPDPLFQAPGGTPTECPGGGCPVASSLPGSFEEPSDIEVVGNEVFVLDSYNLRIQVFDTELNLLRVIEHPDWEPEIPDVSSGRYPIGMAVNRANGNVVASMSGENGIEEYTTTGAFVRTITTDFNWIEQLALDHLNNVLYIGDGWRVAALDYTSGAEITTVVNHSVDGELWANVNDIVLQPVERQLIDSYTYEVSVDSYASDTVDRFSYDAAPTCQEFSAGTKAPNPVAVQLSCTDTSPSPQVTYEITAQPTGGLLSGSTATGAFTYTPNAGFTGTDTFKFRAHSGTGASTEYTGTIAVLEEVPVIRKTANLSRSSGEIWVKLPGSDQWVRLEKDALVPIGTIIDAANGYCVITFADADGNLFTGTFWGGVFQILQTEGEDPWHVLKLRDDEFPDSPSQAASASAKRVAGGRAGIAISKKQARATAKKGKKKNKLWGKGKGKFRTSGNGSSGSVRGTRWGVTNYANGTVTQVTEGVVVVRDFYRKRSITLRRGQSYFADKNWKKNRRATARVKPRFTG